MEQKNTLSNGILYLKGGDVEQEIRRQTWAAKVFPLNEHFKEEWFETKKLVHPVPGPCIGFLIGRAGWRKNEAERRLNF